MKTFYVYVCVFVLASSLFFTVSPSSTFATSSIFVRLLGHIRLLGSQFGSKGQGLSPTSGSTYYVCPTGSDSNDGRSAAAPWQTLAKVASTTFVPGTSILLCGTTPFTVTSPAPLNNSTAAIIITRARASGTAANPITLGSYNGTATISDTGTGDTLLVFAPYFRTVGITFTSTTASRAIFYFNNVASLVNEGAVISGNTVLGYTRGSGAQQANAIQLAGSNAVNSGWNGYRILNNTVDGSTGYLDQGITVNNSILNTNGLIQGNIVHDIYGNASGGAGASGNGITLSQVATATVQYNLTYNLGRETITCGGPGGQWTYQSSGVTFQFGEVYNIGPLIYPVASQSYNSSTGQVTVTFASPTNIVVGRTYRVWGGAPATYNRVYTALAGSDSMTLVAAVGSNPGTSTLNGKMFTGSGCDWGGFDLDNQVSNSIVQYTYTHDAFGEGQLLFFSQATAAQWHDNTYRYNLIETMSDAESYESICFMVGTSGTATISNVAVYNNTCWSPATAAGQNSFLINFLTNTTGANFYNNIFISAGQLFIYGPFQTASTTSLFLNNDYYNSAGTFKIRWGTNNTSYSSFSAWRAIGQETTQGGVPVGTTANPLLANSGSGSTCSWTPSTTTTWPPSSCPSGYQLLSGSPMIGTGLDLTQAPYGFNVGTRDYFGNAIPHAVGTGYNIGADGAAR